jgi:hypothetical protein
VARKKGGRQSGRANAKEYSDASDDSTSQLHDTSASEDVTEVGDITPVNRRQHKKGGTHGEIKAMVRDMLLGDVVARQHDGEMAYVDGVIFGICDGTKGMVAHGTTEGGRSIKRTGSGLEADSSNAAKRPRKGNNSNSSPVSISILHTCEYVCLITYTNLIELQQSRDAAMEGSEQHSARQIKIMQKLGLVAPPGSPFKGLVAAAHR